MRQYKLLIILKIILLSHFFLLTSCSDTDTKSPIIDPAFTGYVSGFTSGVISNSTTIKIRLMEEISGIKINEPIESSLFNFSPNIEGNAYWIDSRTIEFRPKEKLPSGKLFDGEFFLSKIKEVPKKLNTLPFQFQTMKQMLFMNFNGMEAYNDEDLTWQKLQGRVQTADISEDEVIEKIVGATQNGLTLNLSWEHGDDGKNHVFTVDSVSRKETRGEVLVSWNGDELGIDTSEEEVIEIPPLGDFKVMNLSVNQQPEQYVTVHFSDPVQRKQDLNGLIYLKSGQDVRLSLDKNEVKVYPTKRMSGNQTIIITNSVKNTLDYQLIEEYQSAVTFMNIKPNVEMIGNGVILPNTNGLIFPFKAVNLSAVNVKIIKVFEDNIAQFLQVNQFDGARQMKRVGRIVYKNSLPLTSNKPIDYGTWNTFSIDLSQMIQAETGAIYRVQISFDQSQSMYPCQEKNEIKQAVNSEDSEMAEYDGPNNNYWDYYDDYYYYDDYNYQDRDNPCKPSYYTRKNHSITRNVLASNLGILAKAGDSKKIIAVVTDLKTTEPQSGVKVNIYNYQNQLMASKRTNSEGMVEIDLESKPFLLVANKGEEKGYLRLDDGSALSMSMFDVGGQKLKKGVKGYIYGERGVWRPGDSLYVAFILEDKNEAIPAKHPVVFELYTPESKLYQRKVKTTSLNGFYDFRTTTQKDDPTGNWLAKVKVGGSSFTKSIKIEAIKPNRLKINLDFNGDILTNGSEKVKLSSTWLHGAIAKNLKADVELNLSDGNTRFEDYPDYSFDDPSKSFEADEEKIYDGNLDGEGKATFDPEISVGDDAPGMLKASFKTRVFEKGGDFSVDRVIVPYSPFSSYAGVKVPKGKGWNDALYANEPNLIPIVTVDQEGNPVNREKVRIEIYDVRWRWWWESENQYELARYISNKSKYLLKTDYVNTVNGKAVYEMKFDKNMWGRKLIRVTDPESGHSTGETFYMTYKGWWNNAGQDNPGGAEMLSFTTDKKKYNVGEDVQVNLPAFKDGRALVSIESGSKIVDKFWIEPNDIANNFKFEATASMAPNIYVHIALIQPHGNTGNDLPIRMYGIQPIKIEDPNTRLSPVIKMPDELAPEQEVTIKVSEKDGKRMTYTLAIVDEGLLDLTRFRTPDPWNHFYQREALGVKTWDMYNYVAGAFTGEMAGLLALGGDGFLSNKGKKKANRFKPMVKFIGPFEVSKKQENTHTFKMPNYIGSVRTMVVAGYEGAYGSSEKTTPVKKPLMVLASLPRVVGPTEKVKLPVTVFAMDKKIKKVAVSIETNNQFTIDDSKTKTITFNELGDQVVNFNLEVAKNLGVGKVKVVCKSGSEQAEYEIELDVRLPNPRITEVIDGVVEPGKNWTTEYKPVGMAGTNNGIIEISTIPAMNLEKRLKYLIRYPHGCIEQTTSSVFPQLFLADLIELSGERQDQIQSNVIAGINKLKSFQLTSGGLSYWPNQYNQASDWGTNYAGHFMLEAKAKGYALPIGFIDNWSKYQKQKANNWRREDKGSNNHYYNSNELTQAYRLYTLAMAKKPALGAMNRMRALKKLSLAAKWRLAGAYALIGKPEVAKAIVNNAEIKVKAYKELSYSYGSNVRDEAMIMEVIALLGDVITAKKVLDDLAENMASNRWYSTQTTAYTLLAVAKFIGGNSSNNKGVRCDYSINGKNGKVSSSSPIAQIKIPVKGDEKGTIAVNSTADQMLFVKVQMDGIPLTGDQTNAENDLKMTVNYLNMEGKPINPSILEQGTDFIAEVKLYHPGIRSTYKEMALTQIFPSGWEIRNTRMDLAASTKLQDEPKYQDIRDDRVLSYFDIQRNSTKTYRVILNAAYLGKFYLPTVYCEAMYDNEINARKAGKWIEVVEPGKAVSGF